MVSPDPHATFEVVEAHRAALRSARHGAVQGEIFFEQIAELIRIQTREYLHGASPHEFLEMITEEDARSMPPPCVNGGYPGDAMTTMPALLLQLLPALPRGVEYRFIDRDLILWDPHANLIVDFISNALPGRK
jgi:hypothetical protein